MKKGFTLIELLAVIVILAVIALIATPMILGVIESVKKGAVESSANGIMDAAETYYTKAQLNGTEPYRSFDLKTDTLLEYKGKKPEEGTLYIRRDGKMSIAMKQDGWCATKKFEEQEVKVSKSEVCSTGETLEDRYARGEAVTIDGDGYHVIAVNGEILTLLLDESVTNMDFNTIVHPLIEGGYCNNTSYASSTTYRMCNAFQAAENFSNGSLHGKVEFNSEIYDYVNDRWKNSLSYKDKLLGDVVLLEKEQYEQLGGASISWLNNGTKWWLKTPVPDGVMQVYYINSMGYISKGTTYSTFANEFSLGVRPVIQINANQL